MWTRLKKAWKMGLTDSIRPQWFLIFEEKLLKYLQLALRCNCVKTKLILEIWLDSEFTWHTNILSALTLDFAVLRYIWYMYIHIYLTASCGSCAFKMSWLHVANQGSIYCWTCTCIYIVTSTRLNVEFIHDESACRSKFINTYSQEL